MSALTRGARAIRRRRIDRAAIGLCVALAGIACDGANRTTAPAPPVIVDTIPQIRLPSPDTITFDLRFKGVGTLTSDTSPVISDFLADNIVSGPNVSGTPVEIGSGMCDPGVPGDCGWQYEIFTLPVGVGGLSLIYRGDLLTNLALDLDSAARTDTVITGLDIEPLNGVFAISEYATTLKGGYSRAHHVVPLSGLQASATLVGAQGRVITAVSFDSGQLHYLSYGWQNAPMAVYEAQVATATFATIGSVAQSLGASGYIITAIGGDLTDGFVLVGTRVQGVTASRIVTVQSGFPDISGSAIVGLISDSQVDSLKSIGER